MIEFRTKAGEMASSYKTMVELLNNKSGIDEKVDLDVNQIHQYFMATLNLMKNTVGFIHVFHPDQVEVQYGFSQFQNYLNSAFTYIAGIQEGASTKNYGRVITNSVNLILWVKSEVNQKPMTDFRMRADSLMAVYKTHSSAKLAAIQGIANQWVINYPATGSATLRSKYQAIQSSLNSGTISNASQFQAAILPATTLTPAEVVDILNELASGLEGLETVSLAINRYGKLMVNILNAKESDDIKQALEETAMKSGGYMVKQSSAASVSIGFYPGFGIGHEFLKESTELDAMEQEGTFLGARLPIGVETAFGLEKNPVLGAIGFYLQVLDLGAVLNYSLNADSTSTLPKFGFEQLLSPGAYIMFHIKKTPIALGTGVSYTPQLRSISNGMATLQANAIQVGAFLAVDLTVFPLFTSRRKFKELPRKFK